MVKKRRKSIQIKTGKITENFSYDEFECHCGCGANFIYFPHVQLMQMFRNFIEKKEKQEYLIIVLSGVRCPEHNNKPVRFGGAGSYEGSQHTYEEEYGFNPDYLRPDNHLTVKKYKHRPCASDITAVSKNTGIVMKPLKLFNYAKEFSEFNGLGLYKWGIHVDSRYGRRAVW